MKKFIALTLITLAALTITAQSSKVVNAYMHYKAGALDKAKMAIDKAVNHPKTSGKSKTWRYQGDIYYSIFFSTNPQYQLLDPNPGEISFKAYKKAKEIHSKGPNFTKEINAKLHSLRNACLSKGVEDYNNKAFDLAYKKFQTTVEIASHLGITDSLAIYNCGLASEQNKKPELAIKWYNECINIGYRPAHCCSAIILILKSEERIQEAQSQLDDCRHNYPNDSNLLMTQLNFYIQSGAIDDAVTLLQEANDNNFENEVLHFTLGSLLDSQGKYADAELSYKKAIEQYPEYFDANYNLGALYFNQGVEIYNKKNEENEVEKAHTLSTEADVFFKKALPYFEKAHNSKPSDTNTLQSLKILYAQLGDSEKYAKINALLDE